MPLLHSERPKLHRVLVLLSAIGLKLIHLFSGAFHLFDDKTSFFFFRDVFTTDVFGFLVFEAIANGETVLIAHKNKQASNLTMRR